MEIDTDDLSGAEVQGSREHWASARRLYERSGFVRCPPFADYPVDPLSAHYRREV